MNRAFACRALTALTLGCLAIPAAAQSSPFGSMVAQPYQKLSKTEAILGGTSKLASIMMSQASAPTSNASPVMFAAAPTYVPVRATSPDRPDVFGSVAIGLSSTPFDREWARVASQPIGGEASAYVAEIDTLDRLAQADAVNRWVNRRVQFANDITVFGDEDRWSATAETLRRGSGDCEDFAIAKLQMLRAAGMADKDLYLVVLRDERRMRDHAVAVVRVEGRLLVLDNGTSQIVDSDTVDNYKPIMTFAAGRAWTHGYRRNPPVVTYASAEVPPVIAPAPSPPPALDSVAIAAASLPVSTLAMPF